MRPGSELSRTVYRTHCCIPLQPRHSKRAMYNYCGVKWNSRLVAACSPWSPTPGLHFCPPADGFSYYNTYAKTRSFKFNPKQRFCMQGMLSYDEAHGVPLCFLAKKSVKMFQHGKTASNFVCVDALYDNQLGS